MKKWLLLFWLLTNLLSSSGQELKVSEFSVLLDEKLTGRNRIKDINNEYCSLIRILTDIDSISLESNRGVEKVSYIDDEVWLWVPEGTKTLKILKKGYPSKDYALPTATTAETIYLIKLEVILPELETVVIRDTIISRSVSFNTNPAGAKLFVNSALQGLTPITYHTSARDLDFKLEKKHFHTIDSVMPLIQENIVLDFNLDYDKYSRKWFISATIGYSSLKPSMGFGFRVGRIGKTGLYFDFSTHHVNIKPDIRINMAYENYSNLPKGYNIKSFEKLISNGDAYYYTGTSKVYASNRLAFSGGITQQITGRFFLTAGMGYFSKTNFGKAMKSKINDVTGSQEEVYTLFNYSGDPYKMNWGLTFESGVILRIGNNLIINLGCGSFLNMDFEFPYRIGRFAKTHSYDYGIGIGYTF